MPDRATEPLPDRPALVGSSLRRFEDDRFLRGNGRFVADLVPTGSLRLHFVRSPHASAVIRSIDSSAARAMPGVMGVFTADDMAGLGLIPCTSVVATDGPMIVPWRSALAAGRVRHVGEAVAFVVAGRASEAEDAAEAVLVDYEALPCVTQAEAALAPGAATVWDEAPGNLAFRFVKGDRAATSAALAAAAHVATVRVVNNRVIVAPLEHRGAVGADEAGVLSLLVSGQGVHGIRRDLAAIFGLPKAAVQVRCPDVGGGFGVKNPTYPEYVAVLWAARRFGRPVCWLSGHGEDFVSTAHGRDNVTTVRLGLDADGRFQGLAVETMANLGAAMSTGGPGSSTTAPGNAMGGGYDIPAICMSVRGAFTHTVPLDAYRGAGKPEANYLLERAIDVAAGLVGIDRVELRRRNLLRSFPHRTAMGTTIDGGRFAGAIDPALAAADAGGFPARRNAAAGRLLGLGVTCFMETARGAPNEGAEIRFRADGRVGLHLGTQSNGQGHETSFPQIAADRLGLPVDCFELVQADTLCVRDGNGHGGARSMHLGGAALADATGLVIKRAMPVAAQLLQAEAGEVRFETGRFRAGARFVGLDEVVRAAPGGSLDSYSWTMLDRITFPNGCHVAEVEIDPETGAVRLLRYTAVDDYGVVVNPMLLLGQVQGGLAQGIGQAMGERAAYDDTGQLLSGSFMDYWLPRAADLPAFDIRLDGVPTDANPLGVKGAGQAGAIAAPPAIVAAVLDALRPLGVRQIDMPLTPERVWRAIREARGDR